MKDEMIMALLAFLGAALVILKPILNLNASITELKVSIDQFRDTVNDLKASLNEQGKEIDKIRDQVVDHEARIKNLEKRDKL